MFIGRGGQNNQQTPQTICKRLIKQWTETISSEYWLTANKLVFQ
jgi:hypothetical protein